MKLSNGVKVYCKSMGQVFRIQHIAKNIGDANWFCRRHADCGVIAEDNQGLVYIAELMQLKVSSSTLPD